MSIQHWRDEFNRREGRELLPSSFPIEMLIFLAKSMIFYKTGEFSATERTQLLSLLTLWVERILSAQDPDRLVHFQAQPQQMLPSLLDDLGGCVQAELLSRQIGHPISSASLSELFTDRFTSSTISA